MFWAANAAKRQARWRKRWTAHSPRLFGHLYYRRGRHVRRRVARVGHRSGVGGQHGGFGHTRIAGLFLGGIGAAYRARFGNRRADHRRRIDGTRRCRRRLQRLATRLRGFGNRGRLGRLQPLQRLGLLAGRPPFDMDVPTTLKTWTVNQTLIAAIGFSVSALLFAVV